MNYISNSVFWTTIIVIVVVLCIAYGSIKRSMQKELRRVEESGRKRSYNLWVRLKPQGLEIIPELKPFFEKKRANQAIIPEGYSADLLFLGSDCKWFVQNGHGYFVTDVNRDPGNITLFYEQVLGKKGDNPVVWSGAGAAFQITQRFDNEKGLFLSLDIMLKVYGKSGAIAKSEKRIHLGEFPIPTYYAEWGDDAFDKIIQWGWKEQSREFGWSEYTNEFGEMKTSIDPLQYENEFVAVTFL